MGPGLGAVFRPCHMSLTRLPSGLAWSRSARTPFDCRDTSRRRSVLGAKREDDPRAGGDDRAQDGQELTLDHPRRFTRQLQVACQVRIGRPRNDPMPTPTAVAITARTQRVDKTMFSARMSDPLSNVPGNK